MTDDVLRFQIGTCSEFVTPGGRRYLRGAIAGLQFTLVEAPDLKPAAGGVMRWTVMASPAPHAAKNIRVPAREAAPADPKRVMAEKSPVGAEHAAEAVMATYARIPPGGDPLPDLGSTVQEDDPAARAFGEAFDRISAADCP